MIQRSPNTPQGILKCRDLVQLYYGLPMVAALIENLFYVQGGDTVQILGPDPRRIKYEIIISAQNASIIYIGSLNQMDQSTAAVYQFGSAGVETISRNFLTDLDSVCLPLLARNTASENAFEVFVRETFLTPAPVDEIPAG